MSDDELDHHALLFSDAEDSDASLSDDAPGTHSPQDGEMRRSSTRELLQLATTAVRSANRLRAVTMVHAASPKRAQVPPLDRQDTGDLLAAIQATLGPVAAAPAPAPQPLAIAVPESPSAGEGEGAGAGGGRGRAKSLPAAPAAPVVAAEPAVPAPAVLPRLPDALDGAIETGEVGYVSRRQSAVVVRAAAPASSVSSTSSSSSSSTKPEPEPPRRRIRKPLSWLLPGVGTRAPRRPVAPAAAATAPAVAAQSPKAARMAARRPVTPGRAIVRIQRRPSSRTQALAEPRSRKPAARKHKSARFVT